MAIILCIGVIIHVLTAAVVAVEGEGQSATDYMFDTTTNVTVYSAPDFPLETDLEYDIDLEEYLFSKVWAESNYFILLTHSEYWGIEIAPFCFINRSEKRSSSVRFTVRTSYYNSNISAQAEEIISCGFPDASDLNVVYVATYENVTITQVIRRVTFTDYLYTYSMQI